MATREDCINAAMRAGATPDEARGIVDGLTAEARAMRAEGMAMGLERELAQRAMRQAELERLGAARQRKHEALMIKRRVEVEGDISHMMADGASFADAITALTVGSSGRHAGARASASARRLGISNEWRGGMLRELDALPGALDELFESRAFGEAVHQEMLSPSASGDARARGVAAIFTRYLEDMRVRSNDAGANIGKLDNYAPQSHNEARILKAGEQAWADFVNERLDWERSFPDAVTPEARREVLAHVFDNIVTGQGTGVSGREAGTFQGPRNLARGLSQERVLHFKDATASLEYHQAFGRGNIVQAVVGQMERMSARLSLMEIFGPNPEAMLKSLIAGRARALRLAGPDEVRALARGKTAKKLAALEKSITDAHAAGDEALAQSLGREWDSAVTRLRGEEIGRANRLWKEHRGGRIGAYYAMLAGETGSPVNPTAARISSDIRGTLGMSKLGMAFISAFADVNVKAVNLMHNGENFLSAWKGALDIRLERLQSQERKEFGRALGMYSQTLLGSLINRFDSPDAPSGAMARWTHRFFKLSGLEGWTEGHKASYAMILSHKLGEGARGDFAGVNADFGVTLKRHGLDRRWDLIKKMARQEKDGEWHVLPERAYALSDADIEAQLPEGYREGKRPADPERAELWDRVRAREQAKVRRDTATSLMAFFGDETRYAVLEPDEKTRSWMLFNSGAHSGTILGEFLRFMTQFKSFPVSYMQRILVEKRWGRASKGGWDMPGAVHYALGALAFGYLAMSAKDILKGKSPKDPKKLETWLAAATQSGGLGIMGDFFLGKVDRFGNQMESNILGPGITAGADIAVIATQLLRGEFAAAGEDAVRLGLNNTPYINLWYTRAALDYLLLYHVREALSPGTLARTERKAKAEYNQSYLKFGDLDLTPSKVIKRGGGFK